jgi:hypothetical protein
MYSWVDLGFVLSSLRWREVEMSRDQAFAEFCRKATDKQLLNIIQKEHVLGHHIDRDLAEAEADKRGFSGVDIKKARKQGSGK